MSFILKQSRTGSAPHTPASFPQLGRVTLQTSRMFCVPSMWWRNASFHGEAEPERPQQRAPEQVSTRVRGPDGRGSCGLVRGGTVGRSWRCWFAATVHAPCALPNMHNTVPADWSLFNRLLCVFIIYQLFNVEIQVEVCCFFKEGGGVERRRPEQNTSMH